MRHPVFHRLRPFLRRDLRARMTSALVSVFVLFSLTWLGTAALGKIDSRDAHQLRTQLGLESQDAVCGKTNGPGCNYEDREQVKIDRTFVYEQQSRLAVLGEVRARTVLGLERLAEAEALARTTTLDANGILQGDHTELRSTLRQAVVDVRPAGLVSVEHRRVRLLWPLTVIKDCQSPARELNWLTCVQAENWRDGLSYVDMRTALLERINAERTELLELDTKLQLLIRREVVETDIDTRMTNRAQLVARLLPEPTPGPHDATQRVELAAWLTVHGGTKDFDARFENELLISSIQRAGANTQLPTVSVAMSNLALYHATDLHKLLTDPNEPTWHGAWAPKLPNYAAIYRPAIRYRSPTTGTQQWQIAGCVLFLLASIMLVVVGPVVTATSTAREREAGTLPVLRMTGLSAGDLALAMTVGPNIFALVAGGGLLLLATPILLLTAGTAVLTPLALLAALSAATHLTAIGLGDALGQRVNAMVVGGLLALAIVFPGLVGAVMVIGDMAATGFLLGPLPATLATGVSLSGMPFTEHAATGGSSLLGAKILTYSVVSQGLLGLLCLRSWSRRVEHAWAQLFSPIEGALLTLASVGCSALAVLDLSERVNVQSYDDVNLITFLAIGFLMPVLGWLLLTSLVRPARASSVASVTEVRKAFIRFQAFVILTAAALAFSYNWVLAHTGLDSEQSEIMWATISQGMLAAETVVATLLLASRRNHGRHRILVLGGLVVLMQVACAVGIYNFEVAHVAITRAAANPFTLSLQASPYWMGFLVVLWAAGFGLVLAALMRERDRAKQEAEDAAYLDEEEDDDGKSRWLH